MKDEQYKPGSFGCHEVLHMTAFLSAAIDDNLMQHTAIKLNPKWWKLASEAHSKLFDLYQAIGEEHLK